MQGADRDSGVRLAELVGAYSLATDLGLGQPMEHVLRSWLIAARKSIFALLACSAATRASRDSSINRELSTASAARPASR